MTVQTSPVTRSFTLPTSFPAWRDWLAARSALPIVGIAGSRGKTTVARLLDAICHAADLRTATWTDAGVEIDGRRQTGELRPWSRALSRLADGSLDLAIQELDWATVHAVGLPAGVYPVLAVTNVCANSEACLAQTETRRILASLTAVLAAVRPDGTLVLNGDEYAVGGSDFDRAGAKILVGQRADTPLLRAHLADGGTAAWIEDNVLRIGPASGPTDLIATSDCGFALAGAASFELQNALTAASVATACGITGDPIPQALRRFDIPGWQMPAAFNASRVGEAVVLIDRPAPPWFLRPTLRAAAHLPHRRLIVVVGRQAAVPVEHLTEIGRLLGRAADVLIVHSEDDAPSRTEAFRRGVALNDVPPLVVHVPTERQATNRALKNLRPTDVVLVLADEPAPVLRAVARASDAANRPT